MTYEYDVFISYAHLDNDAFTREQQGWVTVFDDVLQIMLNQQLGKKARIWRDKTLRGNDDFSAEISDKLPNAATLVSVLTPRYLNSDWCTKEIKVFCQLAEARGDLFVKNKGRVFKVMKSPIARIETDRALPPQLGRAGGYEFFIRPDDGKEVTELDPAYGKSFEQAFLLRVRRLAGDIADLLRHIGEVVTSKPADDFLAKPIYLAECSSGRRADRERLLTDLRSHGYAVVPDDDLPEDENGFIAEAQRLLAGSRLAIHLIGSSYGPTPDGDGQKSTVVLQNELAARLSESGGLARIISLPEGTTSSNPVQQAFIDALKTQSALQRGADLVSGDLQTLIATIHARLAGLRRAVPAAPVALSDAGSERKTVHVLHEQKDSKDIVPLLKCVRAAGFDITWPIFNGTDARQVREANQSLCMSGDALIVYYGAGDATWMYYQQTELKKLRGLRVGSPLQARLIIVAGPLTDDKELVLSVADREVIDACGGWSEPALQPFLARVRADRVRP